MSKLKNPLFSLDARNSLSKAISYVRRRGQNIAEGYPEPDDVKSLAQLSWRHMYQKGVALWHGLSAAEQQEWESLARPKHMTGFAWFMSQMLKPNPGLYLPLQGGTMQGNIEMDGHHIHGLPLAFHLTDPLRLDDYINIIEPQFMNEGARVTHSAIQAIPNNTWTVPAFNTERYDTDTIHDNGVSNSHLTCKTAGKYIIVGQVNFTADVNGIRYLVIRLNGATWIAYEGTGLTAAGNWYTGVSTIYDLALTDYVELLILQNSGIPLNLLRTLNYSPEFMMQRIGA